MDQPIYRAILLAAGEGNRFGNTTPKQFCELYGKKIYLYALDALCELNSFTEIIIVCHPKWVDLVARDLENFPYKKVCKTIAGGITRQQSSYLGLQACKEKTDFVLIHEAVRPFTAKRIFKNHLDAVLQYSAVNTCIPSADTIVHSIDQLSISSIPPRDYYLRGQTPQTFQFDLIQKAHATTSLVDISDDCRLVYEMGKPIAIVQGDEKNIKITTEFDFQVAKLLHKEKFLIEACLQ